VGLPISPFWPGKSAEYFMILNSLFDIRYLFCPFPPQSRKRVGLMRMGYGPAGLSYGDALPKNQEPVSSI
jgi:hypothetical protein